MLPNGFGIMQQVQKDIIRTDLTVVSQKYTFSSFLAKIAKNEENMYFWLTTVRQVLMITIFWACCILPKQFGKKFSIWTDIGKKYIKTFQNIN